MATVADVKAEVERKLGDDWDGDDWTEFIEEVCTFLLEVSKGGNAKSIVKAVVGLIKYGVKDVDALCEVSGDKAEFRDALEKRGVPPALADKLFARYASTAARGVSAWDSLAVACPKVIFGARTREPNSSVSRNANNFPAVPLRAFTLPIEAFVALCDELGFVERLTTHTGVPDTLREWMVQEREKVGIIGNESGVHGVVQNIMIKLLGYCNKHGMLESAEYLSGSGTLVGAMDFVIGEGRKMVTVGRGIVEVETVGTPLLAGEEKTNKARDDLLADCLCAQGCRYGVQKVKGKGKSASRKSLSGRRRSSGQFVCKSERHQKTSKVRQLFNYMLVNGLHYGLYTTYERTALFIRDCHGNLAITPCVHWDATAPLHLPQFLVLCYMLAKTRSVPDLSNVAWEDKVEDVDALQPCGTDCDHKHLPATCSVFHPDSGTTFAGQEPGEVAASYFRPSDAAATLSVHDLHLNTPGSAYLGSQRTGPAWRLPYGEGHAVLKLADIFKQPELEAELLNEARVYDQLRDLQGDVLPRFIAQGRFVEGFLCGLMTGDAGQPLNTTTVNEAFADAAAAALAKLHAKGFLHGDVRAENVLVAADGRPVLIDLAQATPMPSDPEQARDAMAEEQTTLMSELWSMECM